MLVITISALGLAPAEIRAESYTVASPNGGLQLTFALREGVPHYSLEYCKIPLLGSSKLGFRLEDDTTDTVRVEIEAINRSQRDETWLQPWGEKRQIRSNYHELRVMLREASQRGRRMEIVFRVFDDGVGFRYEWPEQSPLSELLIRDELTEFVFAEEATAWWIPAYQDNRYEYLYEKSKVSEINQVHTPVTFQRADGICLSIHEAALTDFASMTLEGQGLTLRADLVPWSDGLKVRAQTPHRSPWRTIQVAETPGDLITSYLILNLNEPSKLADTSWIKPGKYVGIWWEMHLGTSTWASGEQHGATNANVRKLIDFAAENDFDGVLVEGWNQGWDGDWIGNGHLFNFTTAYPDFDLEQMAEYARSNGVYLIGHHETGGAVMNYERQLSDAFDLYERLGIRAVKTGYVNYGQNIARKNEDGQMDKEWHHGQHMVRHYRHVVEEAAKHRIMLDVHEPIKPTGIRRTYPNLMTQEGARGQEFNAWSPDGGNPPEHTTILPFTRLLGGPMDFTPGIFDLLFEEARPENRVNTTLAKQLALYVVIYSPLQMVPDLPENYQAHADAFRFIRAVPTDWDDTRVLNASIGDYVTIVRKQRDGAQWFLGSITDEQARTFDVSLSFLDSNCQYVAEIYRDGDSADWQENPTSYMVEQRDVDSNTVLRLRLAAGGGQAIRFSPKPK